jgi:hypothetical protein
MYRFGGLESVINFTLLTIFLGLRPTPAMLEPCVVALTDPPLVVGVRRTNGIS